MNYKKYFFFSLPLLFSTSFTFSQTKEEIDKIMRSQDPKEISLFVQKYPSNPNVNFLSNRLKNLSEKQQSVVVSKPEVQSLNAKKLSKGASYKRSESGKKDANTDKTVSLLNNLFSTNRKKSEVLIMIKNNSDCYLMVKIDGKKFFNMDIPKKGDGYLLIPKGTYKITTKICDANYQSTKNITEDLQIVLDISH